MVRLGREPWSSGYGKRLMFQMLWVRILAQYTGWTFFTYICCKNVMVFVWKDQKTIKEAGFGTFLIKNMSRLVLSILLRPLICGQSYNLQLFHTYKKFQTIMSTLDKRFPNAFWALVSTKLCWLKWANSLQSDANLHWSRNSFLLGSGWARVDRAVASDTAGPRFESSHRANFMSSQLGIIKRHSRKERPAIVQLKQPMFL